MNQPAENLDFEKATVLRDRISAVKKSGEKQKIINTGADSADVIGTAEFYDGVYISVLIYRENRLYDKAVFEFEKSDKDEDIFNTFMEQFYKATMIFRKL